MFAQVALSNKIIELLEAGAPASAKGIRANVTPQAELLLTILRKEIDRPDTPLGTSCLITGTRQDPNLVSQLRKEFATADSADILCSFIKWSGVRIIEDSLRTVADSGTPIRVITTSYMGPLGGRFKSSYRLRLRTARTFILRRRRPKPSEHRNRCDLS